MWNYWKRRKQGLKEIAQLTSYPKEAAEIANIIKGWGLDAPEIGEYLKPAMGKVLAAMRWADNQIRSRDAGSKEENAAGV